MTITANKSLLTKIENALSQIRPFLLEDGGDVELLEVTDELVARVEFKGACRTCTMSNMTFTAGVEDAIRRAAPEIKKVETAPPPPEGGSWPRSIPPAKRQGLRGDK